MIISYESFKYICNLDRNQSKHIAYSLNSKLSERGSLTGYLFEDAFTIGYHKAIRIINKLLLSNNNTKKHIFNTINQVDLTPCYKYSCSGYFYEGFMLAFYDLDKFLNYLVL